MGTILVLYHSRQAPIRRAISDHLYSFRRYGGRRCIYINMAVRSVPAWIHELDIDLVVIHTMLLAARWDPDDFRDIARRMGPVMRLQAPRVALPQDEFLNTDVLVEVLDDVGVDHVFTCAPKEEWATIYGPLMAKGVGMTRVLPGYLEPDTVLWIDRLSKKVTERDIDIGYRAAKPRPWLGRHGMMKGWIADAFETHGRRRGLRVDISTEERDTLLGDAWYRFLLRSRYTIGVESGASVLDRDGRFRRCSDQYGAGHPNATFEDVERSCFPGRDGQLNLRTIAPRHLEACATRTPQILVEGSYSGILQPGRHYIPVRSDFSNLSDVLDDVASGEDHRDMVEEAHADIVASGNYGYEAFVRNVVSAVPIGAANSRGPSSIFVRGLSAWEHRADGPSWGWVRIRQLIRPVAREALRRFGVSRRVRPPRTS